MDTRAVERMVCMARRCSDRKTDSWVISQFVGGEVFCA